MIHLEGKKTLITGGSRGIGRAASILFSRAGSDVAINFVKHRESAERVKDEIARLGRECLVFKADISKKEDVDSMVK